MYKYFVHFLFQNRKLYKIHYIATAPHQTFRVIISQKEGQKMIEGGCMYGMQRKSKLCHALAM